MISNSCTIDQAIRTGAHRPVRRSRSDSSGAPSGGPRNFYLVFGQRGDKLGYIADSSQRPRLGRGGPTYLLKRTTGR